MYEAIGQATQTTIDPALKDEKIETVMGKLECELMKWLHKVTQKKSFNLVYFFCQFCQLDNMSSLWKALFGLFFQWDYFNLKFNFSYFFIFLVVEVEGGSALEKQQVHCIYFY